MFYEKQYDKVEPKFVDYPEDLPIKVRDFIKTDLKNNLCVLAEGIQTILRKHRIPNSYEILHKLTRRHNVTEEDLHNFIEEMPENIQEDLKKVTLENYIGFV